MRIAMHSIRKCNIIYKWDLIYFRNAAAPVRWKTQWIISRIYLVWMQLEHHAMHIINLNRMHYCHWAILHRACSRARVSYSHPHILLAHIPILNSIRYCTFLLCERKCVINNFWLRIQFLTVWKSGTPIFNELPSGFCRRSNSRFLFFFFSYASHLVIAVFLCEPRSMCIKNIYRIILHLHPENNRFDDILIKCLAASSTRQLAIVCSIFQMSIKSSVLLQCTVKRMLHTAENNYAR